jgi:hypothetical protein
MPSFSPKISKWLLFGKESDLAGLGRQLLQSGAGKSGCLPIIMSMCQYDTLVKKRLRLAYVLPKKAAFRGGKGHEALQ